MDTWGCSLGYLLLQPRRRDGAKEGFGLRVASGALAGCTAWSTIYPIDVLRFGFGFGLRLGSGSGLGLGLGLG